MDKQAKEASCRPFYTYRLVYFGNKELKDLRVHELEEVDGALSRRRDDFVNCFPNISVESLAA